MGCRLRSRPLVAGSLALQRGRRGVLLGAVALGRRSGQQGTDGNDLARLVIVPGKIVNIVLRSAPQPPA